MSGGHDARGVEVVVFDMDDTLYPEMQFVEGGMDAAAGMLAGMTGTEPARVRALLGTLLAEDLERYGRARSVFDRALERLGARPAPDAVAALVRAYRTHTPRLEPFGDVRPALEALAENMPLGLITDGPPEVQRAKFAALGLADLFSFAVFTGDEGPAASKPAPRAFEQHEAHFGLPPASFAYVADNPAKDFVEARRRGWFTVRVCRPGGLHATAACEPSHEAAMTFADLSALPRLFDVG